MKKAGILTIVIIILAAAGIGLYQYRKSDKAVIPWQERGTLVKEENDGRNFVCEG